MLTYTATIKTIQIIASSGIGINDIFIYLGKLKFATTPIVAKKTNKHPVIAENIFVTQ